MNKINNIEYLNNNYTSFTQRATFDKQKNLRGTHTNSKSFVQRINKEHEFLEKCSTNNIIKFPTSKASENNAWTSLASLSLCKKSLKSLIYMT